MIKLATINIGNTQKYPREIRANLMYDQDMRRIYVESRVTATEELDVYPETIEQAKEDIDALYGNQNVWDLRWIKD